MSEFLPFPQKKYNIIYADPPWGYSDRSCIGNAEDHYETMTFKDLCRLPVSGNGGGDHPELPQTTVCCLCGQRIP